jgi:hypothetical protein
MNTLWELLGWSAGSLLVFWSGWLLGSWSRIGKLFTVRPAVGWMAVCRHCDWQTVPPDASPEGALRRVEAHIGYEHRK